MAHWCPVACARQLGKFRRTRQDALVRMHYQLQHSGEVRKGRTLDRAGKAVPNVRFLIVRDTARIQRIGADPAGLRALVAMRRLPPQDRAVSPRADLIFALDHVEQRRANPDKLPDGNATATRAVSPQQTCAAQSTYDLIQRELFRRAAALRGSDQAAFDKLAAYAVVRVDRPLLASEDEATGAIGCTGSLTLDLPPGVAVVGGRRTLPADIGYTLQGAADGNGQVLTRPLPTPIVTRSDACAHRRPGARYARPRTGPIRLRRSRTTARDRG